MKKMRGFLSVIIAVLIMFPFAIANAEDVTYSYEFVYDHEIATIYPYDKYDNVTVSVDPSNYLEYVGQKYIFEGYFADANYTTEYVFGTLTKDTKIYLKFTARSVIDSKIKEKLDAANLKVTSTLTEKEGADLYKSDYDEWLDTLTVFSDSSIPEINIDGYTVTFDDKDDKSSKDYYLSFIVDYGIDYYYYHYNLPISYSNENTHDSDLQKLADPYNEAGDITIPGLIDYTNIPDYEDSINDSYDLLSEDETKKLFDESVKRLDNLDKFDLSETMDGDIYLYPSSVEEYGYYYLLNGNNVYGYLDIGMISEFAITVDQDVENSHAAYYANVKEKLKSLLESKGYTQIKFEDDNDDWPVFDNNYIIYLSYYDETNDQNDYRSYLVVYMMKDYNTFLLAKNLTTDYTTHSLFDLQAYSYNEVNDYITALANHYDNMIKEVDNQDAIDEIKESKKNAIEYYTKNYLNPIEELKTKIENDGYDFFDGYLINDTSFYMYSNLVNDKSPAKFTFTVGTENNNRRIRVYHKKQDGTVEKFEGIVKDGMFTIEVTELSPFAVGLGEVVKALKNNPQTFDPIILSVLMLALSAIGLIGGSIYLTKSRLN